MFRAIPATRPCAAACSGRIEIQCSWRAALLAFAWLALFDAMILGAVALPLPARIAICVWAATGCVPTIRASFMLRGSRAVRCLQWSKSGLWAGVGQQEVPVSAEIAAGSFRLGRHLLVLRLKTCDGMRTVLIDGGRQESRSFQRLCRYLESRRHYAPQEGQNQSKTERQRPS